MADIHWRPLSLKEKIILILIGYAIALGAVGKVSFDDLDTVGRKLEVVELADNLNWVILEIRRYEKNYLLYQKREDLDENRRYVGQALDLMGTISQQAWTLRSQPLLSDLQNAVRAYRDRMEEIADADAIEDNYRHSAVLLEDVRELGQRMLDLAEQEVAFERSMIRHILETLRVQLITVFAAALGLGVVLPFLAFRKFFKLLHLLRRTTEHIAGGRFEKIPVQASEIEMRQLMEAFNQMVEEIERHEAQMIQAQKLSSLGTMAAGVAHQLNNPLNNIWTSCQIAIDELQACDPPFMRKMLDNIDQETVRARDIVKGLLEFSRTKVFSMRWIELAVIAKRALTLVAAQVPAEVEVHTDIPPNLKVQVDVQRFQEVLLNLLLNSVQAIGAGPGRITLSAAADGAARQVVITVQDTGAGIPAEVRGRIFDPFFTTKSDNQGTGLGLAVAYGIIKQHRGSIAVQSEPGQGTTFVIRLPLEASSGAENANGG
ncbi:MAG: ATP-binding protein [Desulfobacteraceae bacterium]|nr:ATP-binding protein [Desulfobacteraceae bacterium]